MKEVTVKHIIINFTLWQVCYIDYKNKNKRKRTKGGVWLPGKYFPTMRKMRFPDLSQPWREKNWRKSRSEKSSSEERCWAQSCHCSSGSCSSWISDKKGVASTPKSEANTSTENSSEDEPLILYFFGSIKLSLLPFVFLNLVHILRFLPELLFMTIGR